MRRVQLSISNSQLGLTMCDCCGQNIIAHGYVQVRTLLCWNSHLRRPRRYTVTAKEALNLRHVGKFNLSGGLQLGVVPGRHEILETIRKRSKFAPNLPG